MKNESETRAEYIDTKLAECGWGIVEDSKINREYFIANGPVGIENRNGQKSQRADYLLTYKNKKLAVVEAKAESEEYTEGVAQAKDYAKKLNTHLAYSTNGHRIYEININTGEEKEILAYPTPEEMWNKIFNKEKKNEWKEKFDNILFESMNGSRDVRYYQDVAVDKTMQSIADDKQRLLLTLATGTGKTFIAFQIIWKLYKSKWNKKGDDRRPRILFLADRNVLADQAYLEINPSFDIGTCIRIDPKSVKEVGSVPKNGNIFFTIFQTFMTINGETKTYNYGDYTPDFFDFIIIDECHRGGANDESNWRGIMEYFNSAVQLGLTATPRKEENKNTYEYFGNPIYTYSLREGINDGFLTPFRIKRIQTTIDNYTYTSDDMIVEGEVEEGKEYVEEDFARGNIHIREREEKRVQLFLENISPLEKSIVFCARQNHALLVRDLINKNKDSSVRDVDYCHRVTAIDGLLGEQYLKRFQDNENIYPTILTTSQKLSTGVNARNVRNICIMRPINSIVEFKQIIGRGTRLYDGKDYFTIIDFVGVSKHFSDPEWDGDAIEIEENTKEIEDKKIKEKINDDFIVNDADTQEEKLPNLKIKLRDGKEREIDAMIQTQFYDASGKPISLQEYLDTLFGKLPELFTDEEMLRNIWKNPETRQVLLNQLENIGYGEKELLELQKLINAEKSDVFDVLNYLQFVNKAISRKDRIDKTIPNILENNNLKKEEIDFILFILSKYQEEGYKELSMTALPEIINLKYGSPYTAKEILGDNQYIQNIFIKTQEMLYKN